MDVGDPSNFARLLELHDASLEAVRRTLYAASVTEEDTRATIRAVYTRTGYVLDPHSAVGWAAADRFATTLPLVTLATAHPAKFDAAIRQELGFAPSLPPAYAGWQTRPIVAVDLEEVAYDGFRRLLVSRR